MPWCDPLRNHGLNLALFPPPLASIAWSYVLVAIATVQDHSALSRIVSFWRAAHIQTLYHGLSAEIGRQRGRASIPRKARSSGKGYVWYRGRWYIPGKSMPRPGVIAVHFVNNHESVGSTKARLWVYKTRPRASESTATTSFGRRNFCELVWSKLIWSYE